MTASWTEITPGLWRGAYVTRSNIPALRAMQPLESLARQMLGEMDRLKVTMLMPLHGETITGEGIERVRALLTPVAR